MKALTSIPAHTLALIGVPLLIGLLLGIRECRPAQKLGPDLREADLSRLAELLREHGLDWRLAPGNERGDLRHNGFLTTTDLDWRKLHIIPKAPEQIGRWQGTVYCERLNQPNSRDQQIPMWGDCCVRIGPFVFFGDRAMLAQLREALRGAQF
jgi:hypothetical protein